MSRKENVVQMVATTVEEKGAGKKVMEKETEKFQDLTPVQNEIKNLANVVGLSYESTDTPEEIIAAIADELEAQIDEAENNPKALSTLMGYYNKLNELDDELEELYASAEEFVSSFGKISTEQNKKFEY